MNEKTGCEICGRFTPLRFCGKCIAKAFQPPEIEETTTFIDHDSEVVGL